MEVVAARLGVSPQFISLLENARRHPSGGLVARAAELFADDPHYVAFLAQRMPIEQKRALAESPTAPDYIPRELRARVWSVDGEEALLRQLLLPVGWLPPERDAPYYGAPSDDVAPGDQSPARAIIARITAEGSSFSPKARAWAAFHAAYLTRLTRGREAALPAWEALASDLDADTSRPYGPTIRRFVAMQQASALHELGRAAEAEAHAARAVGYAADADDPDAAACAAFTIAAIRASAGDILGAAVALEEAVGRTGLSSEGRARSLATLATALGDTHEYVRARDVAERAAPLLRTTSLDLPTPERSAMLLATQAVGAEAFAEQGDLDTADVWLNRARSLRPRATADAATDMRLTVAASLLFIKRRRPGMARRRVAELLADGDATTHDSRRALRIEGIAAMRAGDYPAAHAAATRVLDGPTTGVAIQDIAAAGWALLTRCEAYLLEGAASDAAAALSDLNGRVAAACAGAPAIQDAAALVGLRADMATLATRLDGG